MLTVIQVVNVLAFAFMAYVLADVLAKSLKESGLLKPIAMTVCSVTIAFHLYEAGNATYIVAAFAGFFLHTCVNAYTKRVKAPTNRKKSVKINP
jgi:fructose-specific phosphotransferase system IIC component